MVCWTGEKCKTCSISRVFWTGEKSATCSNSRVSPRFDFCSHVRFRRRFTSGIAARCSALPGCSSSVFSVPRSVRVVDLATSFLVDGPCDSPDHALRVTLVARILLVIPNCGYFERGVFCVFLSEVFHGGIEALFKVEHVLREARRHDAVTLPPVDGLQANIPTFGKPFVGKAELFAQASEFCRCEDYLVTVVVAECFHAAKSNPFGYIFQPDGVLSYQRMYTNVHECTRIYTLDWGTSRLIYTSNWGTLPFKLSRYGYEPVEAYSLAVDKTGEPVSADVLTGSKIVEK